VKTLARLACVLLGTLLGACGGAGGHTGSNGTGSAPAPQDARLVLDSIALDQGDWAE